MNTWKIGSILVALIVVFAVDGNAEDSIAMLVKSAPGMDAYPNEDGVILLEKKVIEVRTDRTVREVYTRVFKIFTRVGLEAYSDPRFVFHSDRESIKVIVARTFMRDGSVVNIPDNAVQDLVWSPVSLAPAYTHLHEFIVDHTALEKEAVIHLEIEKHSSFEDFLSGIEVFQRPFPVLQRELEVRVPDNIVFQYRTVPETIAPEKSTKNGLVYRWIQKDLKPVHKEKAGQDIDKQGFRILYAFTEWDSWVDKFREALKKADNLDKDTLKNIEKEMGEFESDIEILHAAHRWIFENIRTVQIPLSVQETYMRGAMETFRTRYGTPLDKAILFSSILQGLGVLSHIALSGDMDELASDSACPAALNSVWVVAIINKEEYWTNPLKIIEAGIGMQELFGQRAIVFSPSHYWMTKERGGIKDNTLRLFLSLNISQDAKIKGNGEIHGTGYFSAGWRGCERAGMRFCVNSYIQPLLGRIHGIFLERLFEEIKRRVLGEFGNPTIEKLCFSFSVQDAIPQKAGLYEFIIRNSFITQSLFDFPITGGKRFSSIVLPVPFKEESEIEIKFPKEWRIAYIPQSICIENNVGAMAASFEEKDGVLNIKKSMTFKSHIIPQNQYDDFLNLIVPLIKESSKTLLFKSGK